MGDIADDHIDQMISSGTWGYAGYAGHRRPRCERCGSKHVYWTRSRRGYQLNEIGTSEPHRCPTNAEGFGDVESI